MGLPSYVSSDLSDWKALDTALFLLSTPAFGLDPVASDSTSKSGHSILALALLPGFPVNSLFIAYYLIKFSYRKNISLKPVSLNWHHLVTDTAQW